MEKSFVYRAEYSLSDRAACKKCQNNIAKDVVRLSLQVQSRFHDGVDLQWHHPRCFFQRQPKVKVDEIWHFHDLRWEDQLRIRKLALGKEATKKKSKAIEISSDEDVEIVEEPKGKGKRGKSSAQKNGKGKKQKGDDESELGDLDQTWKAQTELIWKCKDQVSAMHEKFLKELLQENDQHVPTRGKIPDRVADLLLFGATKRCEKCKENGYLVISADAYYCIGDVTEWAKCDFKTQSPPRNAPVIPANLIKKFSFLSEYLPWTPRERLFPACFRGIGEETKVSQIKASNGKRAVTTVDGGSSSKSPAVVKESTVAAKFNGMKPLATLKIGAVGTLTVKRNDMIKTITGLGGLFVPKAGKDTFVVISNEKSLAQRPVMLEMAETCGIHVVPIDFLDECQPGKLLTREALIEVVERMKINAWKTEPILPRMIPQTLEVLSTVGLSSSELHRMGEKQRSAQYASDSQEGSRQVLVKNGGAIDPLCELNEDTHSVFRENGVGYSYVLARTDVQGGANSFYKMQIIKHDRHNSFHVFRSWGRIGTTIGGTTCKEMDKDEAIEMFEFHFMDKSGNEWKNCKDFKKRPGKYFLMEIDFGEEEEAEEEHTVAPGAKSTLAKPIQDVIKMIFDVEEMKKTMKTFEIDLRKMPLGKLSRRQILDAMQVLSEVQVLLERKEQADSPKIIDATNRFFTLIPHDFGMDVPPLLNQAKLVKDKLEMLDSLLEIEVAFNILRSSNRGSDKDPIDQHFAKLKCSMDVLDKKSVEYQRISAYVKNTHAATHSDYTLELIDVFCVARQGEADRFQEFKELHNHKLLWHGSRTTNYAGILSQGLRIAPPEAPVTGYMFGKGVYFADMISKSANYCFANSASPVGLMLLSDVALGNMQELLEAKSVTRLPADVHSVKGCGRTHPNPAEAVIDEEGVEIPLGHPKDSGVQGSTLLYNEYIVYKEAQVNIRYLLKVKFNYNSLY